MIQMVNKRNQYLLGAARSVTLSFLIKFTANLLPFLSKKNGKTVSLQQFHCSKGFQSGFSRTGPKLTVQPYKFYTSSFHFFPSGIRKSENAVFTTRAWRAHADRVVIVEGLHGKRNNLLQLSLLRPASPSRQAAIYFAPASTQSSPSSSCQRLGCALARRPRKRKKVPAVKNVKVPSRAWHASNATLHLP
jgi:hypothetical protein